MAQVSANKPKNRRYRGAKISEYCLRRVVECFARDQTAADAAEVTKLSKPTVEAIYRRLRERLSQFPIVRLVPASTPSPAMQTVVNRRSAGVSPTDFPLHEMAMLTRILNAQHFAGFEELSAANAEHVARAVRLMKVTVNGRPRYNVYERLSGGDANAPPKTRPFDPLTYDPASAILVNEMKANPQQANFDYIWKLLLKHPL